MRPMLTPGLEAKVSLQVQTSGKVAIAYQIQSCQHLWRERVRRDSCTSGQNVLTCEPNGEQQPNLVVPAQEVDQEGAQDVR